MVLQCIFLKIHKVFNFIIRQIANCNLLKVLFVFNFYNKEMFSLLPAISDFVPIGWIFFLFLRISATLSSNLTNILSSLFWLYSSIFLWVYSISLGYSIKALKSLKYFKPKLSRLFINNWNFVSYWSLVYELILSRFYHH